MAPRKARTWISLCLCACFALWVVVGSLSFPNALACSVSAPSPYASLAQDSPTDSALETTAASAPVQSPAPAAASTQPGANASGTALPNSELDKTKPKLTLFEEILANPLLVASIMFAVLYLGVLLPAQRSTKRAQREQEEQVANLKKNDRVVTSFGVHGVVVSTTPDAGTVTIRIDESSNAKLTVNRDTIRVVKKD